MSFNLQSAIYGLQSAVSSLQWLCIKVGRGQGDGDIGTCVWGLGTWGREMRDLRTSNIGRGDVKTRDAGDAVYEYLSQKSEVNAMSLSS